MDAPTDPSALERMLKKPSYPIGDDLRDYLRKYRRERQLPVTYEQLRHFQDTIPLTDAAGRNTLWETVIYPAAEMNALNEGLKRIYALLRVDGDASVMEHLFIDRVDFCAFGNSTPFRIRIVNAYNDNQDYFYVKKADASRVYGLELEHLLSPNRLNFLTSGNTLIEEHIAGIPGDIFIERWLRNKELKPIRIAKELVKFNERCFVRLLGDMRSYNFVVVITPDFEDSQIRIRAMDFDQQSYHGRKSFYLPQYFKDNTPLTLFCAQHLHVKTAQQYQREEQTLILQRAELSTTRLGLLLDAMGLDTLAPPENVVSLREGLADHFKSPSYLGCETMGALVRENLKSLRRTLGHATVPPFSPAS
ncbi:MAG: hypothetical protein PSW75_12145 [bacterium]|nr:hypothetical protein [bacterium]MDI1337211.1 hypothetical protein [Lacunisphaera sp.]